MRLPDLLNQNTVRRDQISARDYQVRNHHKCRGWAETTRLAVAPQALRVGTDARQRGRAGLGPGTLGSPLPPCKSVITAAQILPGAPRVPAG
jgi:hypothetical protein